jgi:hypothetical protein
MSRSYTHGPASMESIKLHTKLFLFLKDNMLQPSSTDSVETISTFLIYECSYAATELQVALFILSSKSDSSSLTILKSQTKH